MICMVVFFCVVWVGLVYVDFDLVQVVLNVVFRFEDVSIQLLDVFFVWDCVIVFMEMVYVYEVGLIVLCDGLWCVVIW